jgi:hypothetical protein
LSSPRHPQRELRARYAQRIAECGGIALFETGEPQFFELRMFEPDDDAIAKVAALVDTGKGSLRRLKIAS